MQYDDQIGGGYQPVSTWKAPTVPVSQGGTTPPPGAGAVTAPPADLKHLIPGSPTYLAAMAAADNALRNAKSEVSYQRQNTYRQYGYLTNQDGGIAGVDPNNPYGMYQQEKRSEAQQILAGNAAARGGGWGASGMVGQALQNARQGINQGMYTQGQTLQATLHGYDQTLAGAQAAHDQAGADAFTTAWNNAIQGGMYDPVTGQPIPVGDPNTGPGGGSTTPPLAGAVPQRLATPAKPKPKPKPILRKAGKR